LALFLNSSKINTDTTRGINTRYSWLLNMPEDITKDRMKRTAPKVIPRYLTGSIFLPGTILKNSYRADKLIVKEIRK
jgi:hypothetical protein